MESTILDIQNKLQNNAFPNEASISQGIVLRIVRELGWDVYDIDVVAPEYSIGTQRADFALCHPARKPLVLKEVKQPGTMSPSAEEQLAHYAFKQGVPLVVLTSGSDWHFYAPYGPGEFRDRRIHRVDLTERSADDVTERFKRYLSFGAWTSGAASISVQNDLQDMLSKQETRRKLPDAWMALLSEPNAQLVDLLSAELERQTGSEPPRSEVISFLSGKSGTKSATDTQTKKPHLTTNPVVKPLITPPIASLKLVIEGVEIPVKNHRDRFMKVLEYLSKRDPSILDVLHDLAPAGNRPKVATSPEALYPKNPEFAKKRKTAWRALSSVKGWYVDVNQSGDGMMEFMEIACRHAGIRIGKDIVFK